MKIVKEVRQVGTGDPLPDALVTVQIWPAGSLIASTETDIGGVATITSQGSPGDVRIRAERGGPSFDEYSANAQPSGSFDLEDLQTRLASLVTDGILPGYGNQFRATTGSGTITVASGGIVLFGILGLFPEPTTIAVTNGDRALVALTDGNVLDLTEMAYADIVPDVFFPLYRYTVASGQVQASSLTDIGRHAGIRAGRKTQIGIARLQEGSTLSGSGEASGLSVTLELEAATYDIWAKAFAHGEGRDGALALDMGTGVGSYRSLNGDVEGRISVNGQRIGVTGPGSISLLTYERRDTALQAVQWALQNTYPGPFNSLTLSTPGQVAIDSSGRVVVADTGRSRVLLLSSAGAYVGSYTVTSPAGVATDASGNIYAAFRSSNRLAVAKFNSSLVVQWSLAITAGSAFPGHITTNGTHLWVCDKTNRLVYKRLCSTGAAVSSFGGLGSTNGKFGAGGANAIANDGTHLYVTDPSNDRVQKFLMSTGAYVTQWPAFTGSGCAIDASGNVFVSLSGNNVVTRYTNTGTYIDEFSQVAAGGIGVASGDVAWVVDAINNTLSKWDEAFSDLPFEYSSAVLTAIAIPR